MRVQAMISPELYRRMNKIKERRRLRWDDIINAALSKLADDYEIKDKELIQNPGTPPSPDETDQERQMDWVEIQEIKNRLMGTHA